MVLAKRERKRGEIKQQAFSLRSMEFRRLEFVEPRTKVHRCGEGYAWVPKRKDFTKDSKEEIWRKSKFSSLEGVLETSYYSTTLQEVGILHTLVLVPIFRLKMVERVKGLFGQKDAQNLTFFA